VARYAAARPLTLRQAQGEPLQQAQAEAVRRARVGPRSRDTFAFDVAGAADDAEIRALMRESALPGSVSLSFERDPDASIAGRIEGNPHDYIVARERASGRIAAIASRSVRDRFVNGSPARVGYLGQLRVHRDFRRAPFLIDGGFAFCRALHDRQPCALHLASVVSENIAARRVLERGRAGWPAFAGVDDIVTFAVPSRRAADRRSSAVAILDGADVGAAALAAFLWRYNARYQFSPCWNADDLSGTSLPGLGLQDVFVATRGGSIVGCAALWDQRSFKQIVVRGYSPGLRRARRILNLVAPLTGVPSLPAPGQQLRFAFVSHLALEHDDLEVGLQLIKEATRRAGIAELDYIALGLSGRSALAAAVSRRFRHRSYRTTLYAASWPGSETRIDNRPAQPEIAIL
jgi:hypothetical protein